VIEVRTQISSVRRTMGRRTLEAGEARVSTISQVYDTDIDDLWDVVTNPERIPRWFLPITGTLDQGGRYQFTGHAGGTISRCDRPRGFDATWEYAGDVSWIQVRLTPESGGTRFELEHVAHVKDEFWDQFGPGATGIGWDMGLWGLVNYLANPSAPLVGPETAATWTASDDGTLFMRLSSDAWAEAAVADGADKAEAAARADRAYAAYTGTA
jgi:uncharacterized protein YndB with AHSA1/START domain